MLDAKLQPGSLTGGQCSGVRTLTDCGIWRIFPVYALQHCLGSFELASHCLIGFAVFHYGAVGEFALRPVPAIGRIAPTPRWIFRG